MIEHAWQRIESWLRENDPDTLAALRPAATPAEIAATEAHLGVTLPDDLRASYLIHDGQQGLTDSMDLPGLIEGWELLSLAGVRDEWTIWKDLRDDGTFEGSASAPVGPIRPEWWNARWIPLTRDGGGNSHCLDLDPAPGGGVGQIITMWHDDDTREIVAPSFGAWLTQFADELDAGEYAYSEEYGGLVRVDNL